MRVLILGAKGLLGRALVKEWDEDAVSGAGSDDADIRDPRQLRNLFMSRRPECTILAAAYTDVDGCERDPKRARQVNCGGAINVALAAREVGSRLLFISTDAVFDGSKAVPYEPEDPVQPINLYGCSKADAESGIREVLPECCIVRTSWLFGAHGRCFPNTILAAALSGERLAVVNDQMGRPTFNRDLARTIKILARAEAQGIFHVTNSGECTWHTFACELLRVAGLKNVAVEPITTTQLSRPAPRPAYSVLALARLREYGISMRPWREALSDYFADRARLMQAVAPVGIS